MGSIIPRWSLSYTLVATALVGLGAPARSAFADGVVGSSMEHRFQIDFHVPDAALAALLPAGWTPVVATSGAAKDANIRLIFVDQIAVFGADGKPLAGGPHLFAYLAVPAKQNGSDAAGQMIVRGLSRVSDGVPAMPGVFALAAKAQAHLDLDSSSGAMMGQEDWLFEGADGEHLEAHIVYERAGGSHTSSTTKIYSALDPAVVETWKSEQSLDIMRNATIDVGARVKSFSYKVGGGAIASLFDGTEKMLSLDSLAAVTRTVSKP